MHEHELVSPPDHVIMSCDCHVTATQVHYLPAELNFNSPEDIEKWRAERRK